jgi:hypothetical protein
MKKEDLIRKHLKVGSIIKTEINEFWEVTILLSNTFQCKLVGFIGTDYDSEREFYYTIDMIVFNEICRNVD